jgi:4-amino-4-deoxy-L-arabinose transferase-like glycosyltransferase
VKDSFRKRSAHDRSPREKRAAQGRRAARKRRRDDAAASLGGGSTLARASAALLAVACVAPFALTGSRYPDEVLAYWLFGGLVVAAAFVGAALTGGDREVDLPAWAGRVLTRARPVVFGVIVAAAATGLSLFFARFAFEKSASTPDEIAQLWQAKILMHGHLSLPVDPNREFFGLETVVDVGRWYSQFPIGGPLAMVPGALVGAPWLVNPVLLGAATLLLYWFARRAYGEMQGRAIAALFVAAPMVLILAGTWMNHVPVLCLTAAALALLVAWDGATSPTRSLWLAVAIGGVLGLIATIRPLDAVAVALAVGLFQVSVAWTRPAKWRDVPGQIGGGILGAMPLLVANHATTGSMWRFGYDVLWGAGHRMGFHADPYGNTHTLAHGLDLTTSYLGELNVFLLAWPVPAMLILIVALFAMRRLSRWDGLMLAVVGMQLAAYTAYWGEGEFLGPRFLYTAMPALVVLVARTPFVLAERFDRRMLRGTVGAIFACLAIAWLIPRLPFSVLGLAAQARSARQTLKVDIAGAVKEANAHHALVFLREPFTMRLARRLWGIGMTRSDAAQLIARSDACSILTALRRVEDDSVALDTRAARVRAAVIPLPRSREPEQQGSSAGPQVRLASRASLTPECQAELDGDRKWGGAPFGPALPLEEIGADGRIGGDVVYAADLGARNEALRARFGDRRWYRLSLHPVGRGRLRATVSPY